MRLFLKQMEGFYGTRMFRDEDEGTKGGGGEEGLKLSGKFVEKVDPVSKQKIKIPAEFESVLGHFISFTRNEAEGRFKPMLEALENEKADLSGIKAEYEKLKEASMTAEERAQSNAKKVIDEHEKNRKKAEDERDRFKGLFFQTIVRNDILSSFGDTKLFNPQQVAVLFEQEGRAVPEELVDSSGKPTGKWGTKMTLSLENDKGETEEVSGSPSELFKRWIGLDRNLHHVQNDIPSGSGTRQNQNSKGKVDFSKLSPTERMNAARQAQSK